MFTELALVLIMGKPTRTGGHLSSKENKNKTEVTLEKWLPTPGNPDVVGLLLPEAPATTTSGKGF